MLKNAPALAIVAVHTTENEPPKVYESPKKTLFKTRQVIGATEYSYGNEGIEVETRTMGEVAQVIALLDDDEADTSAVSRVMLDNMSLEDMAEAVRMFAGRVETEASGNVTLETVHAIGQTGVTFVSSGALTHSVMALDISLNVSTE